MYFSTQQRNVRMHIAQSFPFLISSNFSTGRFAARNKFLNRPPTPKNCPQRQSCRAGGRVARFCLCLWKLFSLVNRGKIELVYVARYCLCLRNVLTLVHTHRKKLHTIHSAAVFFEARRRKRGSTIQSTTNGNFRCSYISLRLWWWQNALEFEGREREPMPSVVRSTSQKFLAYSGTPSSSYCSTLIYNYFMINLATFF